MMNVLNKKGKTVWLNASPTVINNRLSHDMSRPLLWGDNRLAVIENLLMVREPYYQKALCAVSTDTSDLCGIVVEIVKKLYNLDLLRE
jgi:shikimate kinase